MDNNLLSDLTITLPQEFSVSFSVFSISHFQFLTPMYSRLSKRGEVTVDSISVLKFETLKTNQCTIEYHICSIKRRGVCEIFSFSDKACIRGQRLLVILLPSAAFNHRRRLSKAALNRVNTVYVLFPVSF